MTAAILELKRKADEQIGAAKETLNRCGPRGNRSVESALDYNQGRSDALRDVLALLGQ